MLLAEADVVASPLLNYGALGFITLVFIGWLTWLGKWIISTLTSLIKSCSEIIKGNTDAMASWKRESAELRIAMANFTESSTECRKSIQQRFGEGDG